MTHTKSRIRAALRYISCFLHFLTKGIYNEVYFIHLLDIATYFIFYNAIATSSRCDQIYVPQNAI